MRGGGGREPRTYSSPTLRVLLDQHSPPTRMANFPPQPTFAPSQSNIFNRANLSTQPSPTPFPSHSSNSLMKTGRSQAIGTTPCTSNAHASPLAATHASSALTPFPRRYFTASSTHLPTFSRLPPNGPLALRTSSTFQQQQPDENGHLPHDLSTG